jgi:hypothetical protein
MDDLIQHHAFRVGKENVYWVEDVKDFVELTRYKRIFLSRYSLFTNYADGVLSYGSLDPKDYPTLTRLRDGRKAYNCHTKSMTRISDCEPDKTFYLGYVEPFKRIDHFENFYVFEGNDTSKVDRVIEIHTSYSDQTKTEHVVGLHDWLDDFDALSPKSNHLFIKFKEDLGPKKGEDLELKEEEALIYFVHFDDEGWSVPPDSKNVIETVRIAFKKEGMEWKLLSGRDDPFLVHDWDSGNTQRL